MWQLEMEKNMEPINVNIQNSIRISGSKILYFDPLEVESKHDADYIFSF